MTGVALFVGLREKRIRREIIGKKTLKTNTRNMYFMSAGCRLGGFGQRSPFAGCRWKYSGNNSAIVGAVFGGALIDYRSQEQVALSTTPQVPAVVQQLHHLCVARSSWVILSRRRWWRPPR